MRFIRTTEVGADPLRQLAGRQQAIEFHDVALGMHPFGFNRIEPGALGGQQEGQDAHPFACLLDLLIVCSYPGAHGLALLPGGIVPDQEPMGLALLEQPLAAPLQKLGGDSTDRAPSDEAQPGSLSGQGLGVCRAARGCRSRPGPWDQDRPCATLALPTARDGPDSARHGLPGVQSDSTRLHRQIQSPRWAAGWPRQSNGLGRFFSLVLRVGAGDPVFGALPGEA